MATTLFDLEGKVSLNDADFFTSAETVNTQIENLATAVGNLETKVSGLKISQILDSATFTAEQVVVTGGLDALAEKVSSLKETLSAVDLGGTLLSTVTGGIAALAGNLLVGDIKVGIDAPTTEEIDTALAAAVSHIEGISPAIGITLPDAAADPLATDIATAGTGIVDALETACAWEIPVPTMPSVETVKTKIKAFWQIVTSGLNLSVDAVVNISPNVIPIGTVTGGGEWTGGGSAAGSGNWFDEIGAGFESFGNWAESTAWNVNDFLSEHVSTPVQEFFGMKNKEADVNNRGAGSEAPTSPLEEAVYAALTRWAQPVGGQALAAWMTPQVSSGIAQGTRGVR